MNKQQFIEKCIDDFKTKFTITEPMDGSPEQGTTKLVSYFSIEIMDFLQLKLSECWDMVGEEIKHNQKLQLLDIENGVLEIIDKYHHLHKSVMKGGVLGLILGAKLKNSLTSKQEEEK